MSTVFWYIAALFASVVVYFVGLFLHRRRVRQDTEAAREVARIYRDAPLTDPDGNPR